MSATSVTKPSPLGVWSSRLCLVGAGVVVGAWQAGQPTVTAETRSTEQRQAFLSGSERSELVLKDIHKTLETMDARLATIEMAATKATSLPSKASGSPTKGK